MKKTWSWELEMSCWESTCCVVMRMWLKIPVSTESQGMAVGPWTPALNRRTYPRACWAVSLAAKVENSRFRKRETLSQENKVRSGRTGHLVSSSCSSHIDMGLPLTYLHTYMHYTHSMHIHMHANLQLTISFIITFHDSIFLPLKIMSLRRAF